MGNLKYYEVLQPLIRKRCGEWLTGDVGITLYRGAVTKFTVYANYYEGLLADTLCTFTEDHGKVNFTSSDSALLMIPLTIDDSSPEAHKRSLVGMLDGQWTLSPVLQSSRSCLCHAEEIYFGDSATEAVLKALLHQQGLEV